MKKRVFSAALAGCMMLTMVPVTAFAAEEGVGVAAVEAGTYEAEKKPAVEPFKANADQTIMFGDKNVKNFIDDNGSLILVTNYTWFNEADTLAGKADRSGYYLPMKITIPGAVDATQIVLENAESTVVDGSVVKADKVLTFGDVKDGADYFYLLTQVARMDGELIGDGTVSGTIYMAGQGAEGDVVDLYYDYSAYANKLKDTTKYKNAELTLYTGRDKLFEGKRATELYDASSETAKLVANYKGDSGYYLPFVFTGTDGETDEVVEAVWVKSQKTEEEEDLVQTLVPESKGKYKFVERIADANGKKLYDKLEVTVYPQGKGKGMPSKTLTFDVAAVNLEKGNTVEVALVEKEALKEVEGGKTRSELDAIKKNLDQVQSVVLKDGDLSIKVNSEYLSGKTTKIPVLFTVARDGVSLVPAQPANTPAVNKVVNYGGENGTHVLAWIDLAVSESVLNLNTDTVNVFPNISQTKSVVPVVVNVEIEDVATTPILKATAPVKAETKEVPGSKDPLAVLSGLTAEKEAMTAAGIKDMFTANAGSVVVTDAIGRTLKDTDAVRTGSVVVLKDASKATIATYTIVISGDVTGDGYAHLGQVVAAGRALTGKDTLEGAYLLAGDINGNGAIDLGDIVGIGKIVVGTN
ncbi:MAG: hypothetical protein HFI67_11850 [Lachnospiraceae bacterium]|jgi:hypothetical protein|nr:hypothetical protein [Lachnospiraceae bacterium]